MGVSSNPQWFQYDLDQDPEVKTIWIRLQIRLCPYTEIEFGPRGCGSGFVMFCTDTDLSITISSKKVTFYDFTGTTDVNVPYGTIKK
jgi:hypothetical protein